MKIGKILYFFAVSIIFFISPQILFSAQIKLAWDPNTEPDLAGYKIYWGKSSRSYENSVDVGNVTQYTLTGLTAGETYFIAATAYNLSNNESDFSNEVSGVAVEPETVVVIPPTITPPETNVTDTGGNTQQSDSSAIVVISETNVDGSPIGNIKSYDITSPSDQNTSSGTTDSNTSTNESVNSTNSSDSSNPSNPSDSNNPEVVDSTNTPALDSNGEIKDSSTSEWSSEPDGKQVDKGGVGEKLKKRQNPRKIFTYLGDSNLSATSNSFDVSNEKLTSEILGVSESEREKIIQYVHGYDSYGKRDKKGNLIKRRWLLGSITNSRPLVIPFGNSKSVMYVGANDGMLHAFDSKTGEELWGFIPLELLPRLKELPNARGIKYFIDGSPKVYITKTQKIMVFGLGRGGNYYYALDVTNPESPKFLWKIGPEMTGFSELGQTWSTPQFGKIKYGKQTKVVCIFAGGYDENHNQKNRTSEDKKGRAVYMVDLLTGEQVWRWDYEKDSNMKYCIPSDVSRVDLNGDGYIDRLYVGDLGGRLWKFDLRGTDPKSWSGRITFNANYNFMGSSKRKIFSRPEVTIEKDGSAIVFFGTGDRENILDKTNSDKFYAFVDKGQNTVVTEDSLADVTKSLGTVENLANKDGWFINLINSGEKILSSPVIAFGVIYFTTFTPTQDKQGIARLYALNFRTGNPIFNLNRDNDLGGPRIDLSDRSKIIGKGVPSSVVISGFGRRLFAYTGIQNGLYYTPLREHSTLIPIWWREVRKK